MNTDEKFATLKKHLASLRTVIVAYSGGVDSTLLVKLCADALGRDNVVAITGISQTYTEEERKIAQSIAEILGVEQALLTTDELANEEFASNPADRCYHCKKELYAKIAEAARARGIQTVLDGTNQDDLGDYRPGRNAARQFGVISPFVLAGITKDEIREQSRALGLPTWNKPANPCLASRVPYGTRITDDILRQIEKGERYLREAGFLTVRLRHHGDVARIELGIADFQKINAPETREHIVKALKALGYRWVCLDLEGYRTGSLNAAVPQAERLP
jgi:uncharacterized protein